VPPTHKIPERNQFIPEIVYEMPPVATLTLTASDVVAAKGETVCIGVTAKDFNQILSMQYSMNWDANVLKFKEVRSFGLDGMSNQSFGMHLVSKGILTHSWYDPSLRGFSKPDGHKLYEVCFETVGNAGSKSKFEFSGKPTSIEIANSSSVFLDLRTEAGQVTVK
jgi:Cohesin domain